MVASARIAPVNAFELRAAYKKGYTGSKVERLPNYWASKRNDDAIVGSLKVTPVSWASIFARVRALPVGTDADLR